MSDLTLETFSLLSSERKEKNLPSTVKFKLIKTMAYYKISDSSIRECLQD